MYKRMILLPVLLLAGSCSREADSGNEIFVYGKSIPVPVSVETMRQETDSKSAKKVLRTVYKAVVQHVTQDILDPDIKEIALWCRGYMQDMGFSEDMPLKIIQAERSVLHESIRRDFPTATLPALRPDTTTQVFKKAEMSMPNALNMFLKQYPTLTSRLNRLKEFDREPACVVLWKDMGIRQLKISRFVAGRYGADAIRISDQELALRLRYLNAGKHPKVRDKEALAFFMQSNKGLELFNYYLLAELKEGKNIIIPHADLKKLLIEAQTLYYAPSKSRIVKGEIIQAAW